MLFNFFKSLLHKVINDMNRGINMTKNLNSEAGIVIAESEKVTETQSQTKEDAKNTVKGAAKGVVEKVVKEEAEKKVKETQTNAANDAAAEVALLCQVHIELLQ